MGRIIAIANQKGGVGKTTTAINLSASLASLGQKVLALDMDPQGNMTSGLSVNKDEVENTVYDLIIGNIGIEECICKEVYENLDVLPSNVNLSAAEIELIGVDNKEYIIKNEVEKVKDRYDYIIIDCPPALSMLTINAMTTANSVLVPIQCEYYALEGALRDVPQRDAHHAGKRPQDQGSGRAALFDLHRRLQRRETRCVPLCARRVRRHHARHRASQGRGRGVSDQYYGHSG